MRLAKYDEGDPGPEGATPVDGIGVSTNDGSGCVVSRELFDASVACQRDRGRVDGVEESHAAPSTSAARGVHASRESGVATAGPTGLGLGKRLQGAKENAEEGEREAPGTDGRPSPAEGARGRPRDEWRRPGESVRRCHFQGQRRDQGVYGVHERGQEGPRGAGEVRQGGPAPREAAEGPAGRSERGVPLFEGPF